MRGSPLHRRGACCWKPHRRLCHDVERVCLQRAVRVSGLGAKRLLTSCLGRVPSKATHRLINLPLHRISAQLSLVVLVVFPAVSCETTWFGSRCVPAVGGRIQPPTRRHGGARWRRGRQHVGPRSPWRAAVCPAGRRLQGVGCVPACAARDGEAVAGGCDGTPGFHFGRQEVRPRGRGVVRQKQAALETIQMSVKPVNLKTVTSVGTAKEA